MNDNFLKYPEIKIQLSGLDENAFSILARCKRAMIKNNIDEDTIKNFWDEATSEDYDHLLQTCMKWFDCE